MSDKPNKNGWPKSIWTREKVRQMAKCYAKGGNVTNILVDFAQEVCCLYKELTVANKRADGLEIANKKYIKELEKAGDKALNFLEDWKDTLAGNQMTSEYYDSYSGQKELEKVLSSRR